MGEGRRGGDPSSRRRRRDHHQEDRSNFGIDKSSSDTEVAAGRRSKVKNRKVKSTKTIKERWPFLEGLTVDELSRYRRRRVQNHPRDTLGGPHDQSIGEQPHHLVTEYRRAFRATSEDSILRILESPTKKPQILTPTIHRRDSREIVERQPSPSAPPVQEPAQEPVQHNISDIAMDPATFNSKPAISQVPATVSNPPPVEQIATHRGSFAKQRVGNTDELENDGSFGAGRTEYSRYVSHEGHQRATLARRPTSLKMEQGNMASSRSEQCDKFIAWLNVTRPELLRVPTHLKLEGNLETSTENHDKYVPFVGARRPELLRQCAHLKLEGDSNFLPEYTDVFRGHPRYEKRVPVLPESHLKTSGQFYYDKTENLKDHGEVNVVDNDWATTGPNAEDNQLRNKKRIKEQDMRMLVSKLEDLKGPPLEVPEYKDAYKDFPRERPKLMRPEDEIGRADGTKVVQPAPGTLAKNSHVKFHTKIDQDPEYKSKFLDTDRQFSVVERKPPLQHRGGGYDGYGGSTTTEVRSQYVPYGQVARQETLRMPANLRLEGKIDLQPEYRDAYCTPNRNHRQRERSLSDSRRRRRTSGAGATAMTPTSEINNWLNNNNGEQFGRVNAADQQDAFQVLSTRLHEESVVGKPPPATTVRAARVSSQMSAAASRNRSPSPLTYRLEVCNVDAPDEQRGFGQHPSRSRTPQSLHNNYSENSRVHHRSPYMSEHERGQPITRSYSPSFGRTNNTTTHYQKQPHRNSIDSINNTDKQAFVVLDNTRHDYLPHNRQSPIDPTVAGVATSSRKVMERTVVPPAPIQRTNRVRNKSPTNWMPPWYGDNNKNDDDDDNTTV